MKLNLGSSDRHQPGYINVDIAQPADQIVDLNAPWPWPDSSVDHVIAQDICEHIGDCDHVQSTCLRCFGFHRNLMQVISEIPGVNCSGLGETPKRHPLGRIHFMNNLHRVLKPGARALVETPDASEGVGFYQDPTHCTPWCLSTFKYFEAGAFAHQRLAKSYGITAAFKVISLKRIPSNGEDGREKVWKIVAELEAVK